ncbi:MAG: hypothetical protein ACREN3_02640, partial [Gemmatimonadaceae bacterium]
MRRKMWPMVALMCCLATATAAKAQTRVIHGRVVDSDSRQGIPAALLTVVGGSQGTETSQAGVFR